VTELNAALAGVFTGGAYALVAVCITLLYRSTGVLSFAHAAFAAVGAYLYVDLAGDSWPKPLAALTAVLAVVGYGLIVERLAMRPLAGAPPATRLIGTLGVLTFTSGGLLWLYGFSPVTAPLLLPDHVVHLGDVVVSYQQLAVLAFAAVAAALLGLFLYRTRLGLAVRAMAQDSEAARLAGISSPTVARFNWALSAGLAGATGVLVAPLQFVSVGTFPLLLAKSLAATLVGGLASLALSFAGGLLVGALESVAIVRFSSPGAPELAILLLVVAVLVVRRRWPAGPEAPVARQRPGSATLDRFVEVVQPLMVPAAVVAVGLAIVIPAHSSYWAFVGGRSLFFAIEALSLVLLSGWGGQVSLMNGAYVGIGAFGAAYAVEVQGLPLPLGLLLGAIAGMVLGGIVAIPALRLSGLQFAVVSLVFSGAATAWLFEWQELPRSMPRGSFFGIDLASDISVYFVMFAITAVLFLAAWNIRRSTFGSLLVAARDVPTMVEHFGASAARVRVLTFLFASFVASLGGGLYAVLVSGLSATDFSLLLSTSLLVYAVVGGIRSLGGPIFAAVAFGLVPQLLQSQASAASAVPDIIAGVLVVVVLALRPDGLASLFVARIRSRSSEAETAPPHVRLNPTSGLRPADVRAFARRNPLVRR
jgi:branched-subunit amino acid ABC-type transport system permease component